MAKLLDLSVYGPGHISNILQVDASVYAKAFVTDGGKDTQVVRGDGTLASISSLSVGNADTVDNKHATDFATAGHTHTYINKNFEDTGIANIPFTGRQFEYGILTGDSSNLTDIKAFDNYCQVEYINLPWRADTFGGQIMLGANSGKIGYRTKHGGTWNQIKEILHQLNYTDYTVKKDGTGATGTWGISISGNASSSSIWQNARTLTIGNTGKTINGSADVSWSLSEIGAASSGHQHYIGTTQTQSNSAVQNLTGISYLQMKNSGAEQYINFQKDDYIKNQIDAGSNELVFYSNTNGSSGWRVDMYIKRSELKIGIGNSNPSYPLHVTGDIYSTAWSRAANGFYIHDAGVHYMHTGDYGEIYLSKNNVFNFTTKSWSTLYFNYGGKYGDTVVTNFVWNNGTSTGYASHTLGTLSAKTSLNVINDSSDTTYDSLAYLRAYTNNDWGLIVDKSQSYTYGLRIQASGQHAFWVGNGNSRFVGAAKFGQDASPSYTVDINGDFRATSIVNAESYLNYGNTLYKRDYRFIHDPICFIKQGDSIGTICIVLPVVGTSSSCEYDMPVFKITIYEYSSQGASEIIIGGHNWYQNWYNCTYYATGNYNKGVRLANRSSDNRYCILLGTTSTSWSYVAVYLTEVLTQYSVGWLSKWRTDYSISQITNESGYTITTPEFSYGNYAAASHEHAYILDSGNSSHITFKYSSGGFSSNPTWLGAWNGYELTYVSPSVLKVNYANSSAYATNSTYLYASDSPYRYGDSNPYYMRMRYNVNGDSRWYLSVYPETPKAVAVDHSYTSGSSGKLTSLGNYVYSNLSTDIPTNAVSYKIITSGGTDLGDSQYNVLHIPWSDGNYGAYLLFGANNGRFGVKYKHGGAVREVLDSANYTSYVNNYYWANVKISTTSSTSTSPTFDIPISRYSRFTNGNEIIGYIGRGSSNNNLYFENYKSADICILTNNNLSDCICLKTGGNVGIGSRDPSQRLTVNGNISFTSNGIIGASYGTSDTTMYNNITINAGTGGIQYKSGSWTSGDHVAHNFLTGTSNSSKLVIMNNSGNVGIGTTSPSERLSVNGWVGTLGNTGWYSISHGGGIYMEDSTWVRVYNNKKFYVDNSEYNAIHSAGGVYVAGMIHSYGNYLKSTCNDAYVQIGPQNSSHAHYVTSASVSHWFNKTVQVDGNIEPYGNNEHSAGSTSYRFSNVYSYSGNFAGPITSHNYHQVYNNGSYTNAAGNVTGAIVIQLPITSSQYDMINVEIAVYEYNSQAASKIIVGGHPWQGKWYNYSCSVIGGYTRGVRLGIYGGKWCIILGTSSTVWSYPGVFVTHIGTVYDSYSSAYTSQCTLSLVTSESGFSSLFTPTNVVKATHALDAGNNTPITFHYSTGGFSSNPSWVAAWNGYDLTYVSPSVLNVNYASSATYLYASDSPYRYGDSNPYYMKMRYNVNGDSRWYLSVYPETPKTVAVDYSYTSGNADKLNGYSYNGLPYLPLSGGTCTGNIYAPAFYESSDERLKDFYNSIDVDLDKLSSLPKKFFKWKSNPNGEFEIGTSAQELQKIYPQLVNTDDNGYLTVAYDKLSIISLSAIDKLHLENQDLKHEINLLKQEIEKLKGQI